MWTQSLLTPKNYNTFHGQSSIFLVCTPPLSGWWIYPLPHKQQEWGVDRPHLICLFRCKTSSPKWWRSSWWFTNHGTIRTKYVNASWWFSSHGIESVEKSPLTKTNPKLQRSRTKKLRRYPYLEDHPMTCKWFIIMVSSCPRTRFVIV